VQDGQSLDESAVPGVSISSQESFSSPPPCPIKCRPPSGPMADYLNGADRSLVIPPPSVGRALKLLMKRGFIVPLLRAEGFPFL